MDNLNTLVRNQKKSSYFATNTLMIRKKIFDLNGLYNDYYDSNMDLEFMDRLFYKKNNSYMNCYTLLDKGKFPNYKKIQKMFGIKM